MRSSKKVSSKSSSGHLSKRFFKKKEPKQFSVVTSVDIDTLWMSYYGTYEDYSVLEALASCRESALLYDGDFPGSGVLEGWTVSKHGLSKQGFSYKARRDDVVVLFSLGNGEAAPNMRIEIGSLSCHSAHLPSLVAEIHSIFSFESRKEQVTRYDPCRDVECDFGLHYSHVQDTKNWYWNRKISVSSYFDGDRYTGTRFGKSDVSGRLYDKTYELLYVNKNPHKTDFYSNYYGVDLKKTTIYRLEFQLRRQFLRSFDIDTLEDLLNKRHELWAYLTTKWAFLSSSGVERSTGNSKSDKWEFFYLWSLYLVENKPVARKAAVRRSVAGSDRVFRQGIGCVLSYVLRETQETTLSGLFDEAVDYIYTFLDTQLAFARFSAGSNKYERRLKNYRNLNHAHSMAPF